MILKNEKWRRLVEYPPPWSQLKLSTLLLVHPIRTDMTRATNWAALTHTDWWQQCVQHTEIANNCTQWSAVYSNLAEYGMYIDGLVRDHGISSTLVMEMPVLNMKTIIMPIAWCKTQVSPLHYWCLSLFTELSAILSAGYITLLVRRNNLDFWLLRFFFFFQCLTGLVENYGISNTTVLEIP